MLVKQIYFLQNKLLRQNKLFPVKKLLLFKSYGFTIWKAHLFWAKLSLLKCDNRLYLNDYNYECTLSLWDLSEGFMPALYISKNITSPYLIYEISVNRFYRSNVSNMSIFFIVRWNILSLSAYLSFSIF